MPSYDMQQKWRIMLEIQREMDLHGHSLARAITTIQTRHNVSKSTLRRWYNKKDEENGLKRKSGSGRLYKLTIPQEADIHALATGKPHLSCAQIAAELGIDASRHTLARYLKRQGIVRRVMRNKAFFANNALQSRLDFANFWINAPQEVFDKWVYMDEVAFGLGVNGRLWIHRLKNQAYHPLNTIRNTAPGQQIRCMFFFCPHFNYARGIYINKGPWTTARFLSHFLYFQDDLNELFPGETCSILMDHAGQHLAAIPAINAVDGLSVLPFVRRSQDWNIAENVFAKIKLHVKQAMLERRRQGLHTRLVHIRPLIAEALDTVVEDPHYLLNLSGSMRRRFKQGIKFGGHSSRY